MAVFDQITLLFTVTFACEYVLLFLVGSQIAYA